MEDAHTINHHRIVVDGRIVDLDALHIEVLFILLVQHGRGDVGNILPSIAFSSDIHLATMQIKSIHEVLEPALKLPCNILLIVDGGRPRGEASSGRLIHIDHVGQVSPRVWIADGLVGTRLPEKRAIFLQQSVERTTSRASIQPDSDLPTVSQVH